MKVWVIVEASTNQIVMPTAFPSKEAASVYLQGTCSWNRPDVDPKQYTAMPLSASNLDYLIDPSGELARLRSGKRAWWEVMIGRGDDLRYENGWLIALIKGWFVVTLLLALVGWIQVTLK